MYLYQSHVYTERLLAIHSKWDHTSYSMLGYTYSRKFFGPRSAFQHMYLYQSHVYTESLLAIHSKWDHTSYSMLGYTYSRKFFGPRSAFQCPTAWSAVRWCKVTRCSSDLYVISTRMRNLSTYCTCIVCGFLIFCRQSKDNRFWTGNCISASRKRKISWSMLWYSTLRCS